MNEKFNNYINNINYPVTNPESDTHEGYLVNYEQYKNFKRKYWKGTIKNPPPTPKRPDAKPATIPIKIKPK